MAAGNRVGTRLVLQAAAFFSGCNLQTHTHTHSVSYCTSTEELAATEIGFSKVQIATAAFFSVNDVFTAYSHKGVVSLADWLGHPI